MTKEDILLAVSEDQYKYLHRVLDDLRDEIQTTAEYGLSYDARELAKKRLTNLQDLILTLDVK